MSNTLTQKKPPTADTLACPHLGQYGLVDKDTGEIVQLPCNRYSCNVCGKRKAYKLQKALELRFGIYDYVRLFTFTYRTTIFANPAHAIAMSSEIWRRFINNLRRDKTASKKIRNFQYVRLIEFTKRDYPHYHVLFNMYMPRALLQKHWNHAINVVMYQRGYNGSVNAKGMKTTKNAARYVVKYVLKTATTFDERIGKYFSWKRCKLKLYTKSGDMKLFYESCSLSNWEFVILQFFNASGDLINTAYGQHPQKLLDFYDNLPPPEQNSPHNFPQAQNIDWNFENNYNEYINSLNLN